MSGHFEGNFENDLDLSAMGAGVIPASGKEIVWQEDTIRLGVEGDKIRRIEPYGNPIPMAEFLAPLRG